MAPTWTNWGRTQRAHPTAIVAPRTAADVQSAVSTAPGRVKAVGAGHSFSGAAVTDGILISLDALTGIEHVERLPGGGADVTVRAGTRLSALNDALWAVGLSVTNLGDIDAQSLAGAISTGTHGTGAGFGGLSSQVVGLTLVLADGSHVACTAETDGDLFQAARLGLGAVGILTTVTLRCTDAFALRAVEAPGRLDTALNQWLEDCATVDHPEFYWFPHTDRVMTKKNTRLPGDTPLQPVGRVAGWVDDELLSNGVFEVLNRLTTRFPRAIPAANSVSARALSARTMTDRSYRVFVSPRRVRFREMEFAIPPDALTDVIRAIESWIERTGSRISFPVEVRCAPADDVWLSTAYGRDTTYVAVHQYHRRPHDGYFDAVQRIATEVGGRPHWGKMHTLTASDLRELYPNFDRFRAVRDRVDPHRTFDNPYDQEIFGPDLQ